MTLVPTEHMRAELTACGFRNLRVVARGVDTALFNPARRSEALRQQWGADATTPVLMHVGRLAAEKNLQALTDAFAAVRRVQPRARLVVVGDGPERDALRARVPDAILAGSRRGEDLASHYASGDAFLFPSLTETFGNVTLEAMASGLPVVAFDYAAAAQHLRHGISGMLAGYADARAFSACAVELIAAQAGDPEHLRRMGMNARHGAESLDWKQVVGELEAHLLSAV